MTSVAIDHCWQRFSRHFPMSTGADSVLLELLRDKSKGGDAAAALAARSPAHEPRNSNHADSTLNEVLSRITQLTGKDIRRSEETLGNAPLPFRTGSALAAATANAATIEA